MTAPADRLRVLVVDDEPNIRSTLSICLESLGCEVHAAAGAREALAVIERGAFDVAFLDIRLGSADGLEILPSMLRAAPRLAVVLITAYASVESAVRALRAGAHDYLPKPFTPPQIAHVIERYRHRRSLEERVVELESALTAAAPDVLLRTRSRAMAVAIETAAQAAPSNSTVLLRGESGTGKGVLARYIHACSTRAARRFATVNCPTLSEELLASELFGHARGAFTGAVRDQPGRVEEAQGGSLFLDEIGEISSALQTKLLRFAQDQEFERVGEARTRHGDVRLIAATNRDLEADVEEGRFRLDLLYRLNVIEIRLPPLRERSEDVIDLCRHFLSFAARGMGRPAPELSGEAAALLCAYPWPGNVRELRNEMERAVVLVRGDRLLPESFSERVRGGRTELPRLGGDFSLREVEREHTLQVLARSVTREEAARVLGIDPSTLWRRLRRYEEGSELPEHE